MTDHPKWERVEAGWYRNDTLDASVRKEADGFWHVYVKESTHPGDSRHHTLIYAKEVAENIAMNAGRAT